MERNRAVKLTFGAAACASLLVTFMIAAEAKPPILPLHVIKINPSVFYTWNPNAPITDYNFVSNSNNNKTWTQTPAPTSTGSLLQIRLKSVEGLDHLLISARPAAAPFSQADCGSHQISMAIEAYYPTAGDYVRIYNGDLTGAWTKGSGEFPQPACVVTLWSHFTHDSLIALGQVNQMPTEIRVMAGARHTVSGGVQPEAASVTIEGTLQLTDGGKVVVTDVQKGPPSPPFATITGTVNLSGLIAAKPQEVSAYITYSYLICETMPKNNEYCRLPPGNNSESAGVWCAGPPGFQCFPEWNEIQPAVCSGSKPITLKAAKTDLAKLTGPEKILLDGTDASCSPIYHTMPGGQIVAKSVSDRSCNNKGLCAALKIEVTTGWSPGKYEPWAVNFGDDSYSDSNIYP